MEKICYFSFVFVEAKDLSSTTDDTESLIVEV